MKAITISTVISVLAGLTTATFTCTFKNAITPAQAGAAAGGGSSYTGGGGYTDILNQGTVQGGCSFAAAAGAGTCVTKPAYKRDTNDVNKRAAYLTSIPCLDRMTCLTSEQRLICVDINNRDYIDDEGGCGNWITKEYEAGCLKSVATTTAGGKTASSTGTASASNGTSSTFNGNSSTSDGRSLRVGLAPYAGLLGLIATLLVMGF
jgi:hypothetical protein